MNDIYRSTWKEHGADSFICQIHWGGGADEICACRRNLGFTRGAMYKESQWEQLAELQIDAVALRRSILMEENDHESCKGERRSNNSRLLQKIEARWEVGRTDKADTKKKPLPEYEEWSATDRAIGKVGRTQHALGEQEKEGEASR